MAEKDVVRGSWQLRIITQAQQKKENDKMAGSELSARVFPGGEFSTEQGLI